MRLPRLRLRQWLFVPSGLHRYRRYHSSSNCRRRAKKQTFLKLVFYLRWSGGGKPETSFTKPKLDCSIRSIQNRPYSVNGEKLNPCLYWRCQWPLSFLDYLLKRWRTWNLTVLTKQEQAACHSLFKAVLGPIVVIALLALRSIASSAWTH